MEHNLARVYERIDSVASDVKSLIVAVKGDSGLGNPGILPRLDAIERELRAVNLAKAADDLLHLGNRMTEIEKNRADDEKKTAYHLGKVAGMSAVVSIIITLLAAWISAGHH